VKLRQTSAWRFALVALDRRTDFSKPVILLATWLSRLGPQCRGQAALQSLREPGHGGHGPHGIAAMEEQDTGAARVRSKSLGH